MARRRNGVVVRTYRAGSNPPKESESMSVEVIDTQGTSEKLSFWTARAAFQSFHDFKRIHLAGSYVAAAILRNAEGKVIMQCGRIPSRVG